VDIKIKTCWKLKVGPSDPQNVHNFDIDLEQLYILLTSLIKFIKVKTCWEL